MQPRRSATMSFLIRFAAVVAMVLGLSVLAALAWDKSDQAQAAVTSSVVKPAR